MQVCKYFIIVAAVLMLRVDGAAADRFYLGVHGGPNIAHGGDYGRHIDPQYDLGFAIGLTAGVKFSVGLRAEFELTFRNNSLESTGASGFINSGSADTFVFMINAFYDFDTGTDWIPYAGGGVGILHRYVLFGQDSDNSMLALQLGVGVGYAVTDSFIVSLDYRFLTASDESLDLFTGQIRKFEINNSLFALGLRFEF